MSRLYVGYLPLTGRMEVFRSAVTPTEATCSYAAVIGPFKTRRAADLMARPGSCYETVARAEHASEAEAQTLKVSRET